MAITELARRGSIRVLAMCCMSLLIVGLDVTIVNVALPSIRSDFHASVSQLQWTIDAYTLVLASLLMVSGSTADRRRADRVPRGAGHRRLDAQPGGHVDHPQHLRGPARARAGDRGLGRRGRDLARARPRHRRPSAEHQLAGDPPRRPPGRPAGDRADRALRPGVAGAP